MPRMTQKDIDAFEHSKWATFIAQELKNITNIDGDDHFHYMFVHAYMSMLASMQHVKVKGTGTTEYATIYTQILAKSGYGKGRSINYLDRHMFDPFMANYQMQTQYSVTQQALEELAERRTLLSGQTVETELEKVQFEYAALGQIHVPINKATEASVLQMYDSVRMSKANSVMFLVDEIGSNFVTIKADILDPGLLLYDGKMHGKSLKNTKDSPRPQGITGEAPACMLLVGSPNLIFDGKTTQELYNEMNRTGYGRRTFFSKGKGVAKILTPEETREARRKSRISNASEAIKQHCAALGSPSNNARVMTMTDAAEELSDEYKFFCETRAEELPEHKDQQRFETVGRPQRVERLSAVLAFFNGDEHITPETLKNAIKLTEEAGKSYEDILSQPPNHERLAQYLVSENKAKTDPEIMKDLPFYPTTKSKQADMLLHAKAWGYSTGEIVIDSTVKAGGVTYHRGTQLVRSSLGYPLLAWSKQITLDYKPCKIKLKGDNTPTSISFDKLHVVLANPKAPVIHWTAHHWEDSPEGKGHRKSDWVKEGFNLLVLDIDDPVRIEYVQYVLKDYTYFMHTTKRYDGSDKARLRIVLMLKHIYKLDAKDYSTFMENIYATLPFDMDTGTKDISRKWTSTPVGGFTDEELEENFSKPNNPQKTKFFYNRITEEDFNPFCGLDYLPNTIKNDERIELNKKCKSFSKLELWFLNTTKSVESGRNNFLFKYAIALAEWKSLPIQEIKSKLESLNSKLEEPLNTNEVDKILTSKTFLNKVRN